MSAFNKKDVALYIDGGLTRARRRELEAAAETDDQLSRWLDELTPTEAELLAHPPGGDVAEAVADPKRAAAVYLAVQAEDTGNDEGAAPIEPALPMGGVIRTPTGFRAVANVEWVLGADGGPPPPKPDRPQVFPCHEIDQEARVVRITYPADVIPYGVARVTAEVNGTVVGQALVVFRVHRARGQAIRRGEIGLTDLGIPLNQDSKVATYVVPATDENLSDFPVADIRRLGEQCNGDWELQEAVGLFLRRLEQGTQS